MAERLAGYFKSEDQAQRAVPILRAFGVNEITVEQLEGDGREVALFPVGNNISSASVVPSTGTPPSIGGVNITDSGLGGGDNAGRESDRKRYLLECQVTSEQAPQAIAILLEHGASLDP